MMSDSLLYVVHSNCRSIHFVEDEKQCIGMDCTVNTADDKKVGNSSVIQRVDRAVTNNLFQIEN